MGILGLRPGRSPWRECRKAWQRRKSSASQSDRRELKTTKRSPTCASPPGKGTSLYLQLPPAPFWPTRPQHRYPSGVYPAMDFQHDLMSLTRRLFRSLERGNITNTKAPCSNGSWGGSLPPQLQRSPVVETLPSCPRASDVACWRTGRGFSPCGHPRGRMAYGSCPGGNLNAVGPAATINYDHSGPFWAPQGGGRFVG